jgi:very-short-patch-repair endonuclease
MSDRTDEVRALVKVLAGKVTDSSLSSRSAGAALFGLQNMSDRTPEVEELLDRLAPLVLGVSEEMTASGVQCGLYGLQNMTGSSARLMRRALLDRSRKLKDDDFSKKVPVSSLVRVLSMTKLEVPQNVMEMFKAYQREANAPASRIEAAVRTRLSDLDLHFNVCHDLGFEMDIWDKERRLNIELDGPFHRLERDATRDAFLRSNGVIVRRIETWNRSADDIANDVHDLLAETCF